MKSSFKSGWFGFGLFLVIASLVSCSESGNLAEPEIDPTKELARNIEMLFSDSSDIQFRIVSPRLEKYDQDGILVEEFPEGLKIEFFDDQKNVNSWLIALYAIRKSAEGTMLLRDSVVLMNGNNDKLETRSLEWNEVDQTLRTKKFIRMIQGASQDTLYGTGFEANTNFTNFAITNFIGRRKNVTLSKELGLNN